MKICIYGAGAIGGYMGVKLAQVPGIDVSVIARGAHLEAIRENGLSLEIDGRVETVQVPASDTPAHLGRQDYVIVALKAHQAWQAADDMAPLLGRDTAVLTCQNGVPWWYTHCLHGDGAAFADQRLASVDPGNRQWDAIGPDRAIGCVVYPATEIARPGVIKHTHGDKFAIGEPCGTDTERTGRLSWALEAAGLKAPVLDNIRDEIWLKLWGNLCFNPLSALTRATLDVVATDPGTRAIAEGMMTEAEIIARRLGADFRVSMDRRINGAAKVGAHRTSMLQDLEAGKAMEIDALVGAVAELGRMTDVATPNIDMVLAMVCQLGRSEGTYPVFDQPTINSTNAEAA